MQPTRLKEVFTWVAGCCMALGYLFQVGALGTFFGLIFPIWGHLTCSVGLLTDVWIVRGNLQGFGTDACPTWGYIWCRRNPIGASC